MTPAAMALRTAQANQTISQSAQELADRFNLTTIGDLKVNHRDPQVAALFRQEAVARVLAELVEKTDPAYALPSAEDRMADLTVAQLRERIAEADAETLVELEQLEQDGKQRKGVLEAIAARRAELAEAEETGGEGSGEPSDSEPTPGFDAEGRPLPPGAGA